jgi:TPR repeat protein
MEINMSAKHKMALAYRYGWYGVEKNQAYALQLFTEAALKGQVRSQVELANIYRYGQMGIEVDLEQAKYWDALLAQNNHPRGLYRLATDALDNSPAPELIDKNIEQLKKASKLGYAPASYRLGLVMRSDKWGRKDQSQALAWFKVSAEQNYSSGMNYVGYYYAKGIAVEKNEMTAIEWYTKALEVNPENSYAHRNISKLLTLLPLKVTEADTPIYLSKNRNKKLEKTATQKEVLYELESNDKWLKAYAPNRKKIVYIAQEDLK